ncbi:MAG: alanyl-tRNA editing protein [Ruminococcaceae bacterium]|nr:alanyl-tRNA editing protein [Oscillospiraceae bacterium]
MATEKLYYTDAYLRSFTARVVSCDESKNGYDVVLDRSAFYPEGGGQPGDTGMLGGVRVTDTHERGGEIVHYCAAPLEVGAEVGGEIDWARRFDLMQQHSGEHIVSGLICARFGCDNVGFHLGAESVVIDFNHPVQPGELAEIERAANEVIWENRPFEISYPAPAALEALAYRSKKELSGQVRIVECPGADCCACCGTHVRSAGEVGVIRLLSAKPFRDGVRIEMLAGRRAYDYGSAVIGQNSRISVLLSAKVGETAAAVARVQEELAAAKYRVVGFENRWFAARAAEYAGAGNVLLFEEGLSPDALRRCCELVGEACRGRCGVFSGSDAEGWKYAVRVSEGDLRDFVRAMNAALSGRGGGKANFAQGSVGATRAEIEAFFAANP